MKKVIFATTIVALASICFLSCNSQSKVDWKGIYTGTIPCADCEGISVLLELKDSTYVVNYSYLGKENAHKEQWSGTFSWDKSDSVIKLDSKELPPYYKVGENKLIQLDMEGNAIDGQHADMYILEKQVM
ncbi:MAG: copper resistance protein NlpE [Bacteroidales bacterium]|jgi:uncharacterized lipoprotein NlpE involved in copper resistance|nr:copper resistance protein NlpE [Bacteroidales bacterium]